MTSYDRRNLYKNWGGIGINKIGSLVYRSEEFVRKVFYKILRESVIKSSFGSCGKNVHIAEKSDIKGIGNIIKSITSAQSMPLQRRWFVFVAPTLLS